MSMEDYIISQLYLKLDKINSLINKEDLSNAKIQIAKVLDEIEKYQKKEL